MRYILWEFEFKWFEVLLYSVILHDSVHDSVHDDVHDGHMIVWNIVWKIGKI